jgi:hypothetical protein
MPFTGAEIFVAVMDTMLDLMGVLTSWSTRK